MKTTHIIQLCGLLGGCVVLAGAHPGEVAVVTAPEAKETRRTSAIAPGSGVTLDEAEKVAQEVRRQVPGTVVYAVQPTGSMRPLFDGNCLLLTERAAFEDLQIGDIVVFKHSKRGCLVVHRILERRKDGYWTKGDKNDRMDDDLVTRDNYQARLYGIIYTKRTEENLTPTARQNIAVLAAAN